MVNPAEDIVNGMALSVEQKLYIGEIPIGPFGTIGYLAAAQKGELNAAVASKRSLQLMAARIRSK